MVFDEGLVRYFIVPRYGLQPQEVHPQSLPFEFVNIPFDEVSSFVYNGALYW